MADEYENYTEAGIENTAPAEIEVQPFTRTDVQKIVEADFAKVAGLVKNTVESYPVCPLDVSGGDTQREFNVTPELEQFFQECFEKSKIAIKEGSSLYLMNLGMTYVVENKISGMCFGCDFSHQDIGSHCEISFNDDRTKVSITFATT